MRAMVWQHERHELDIALGDYNEAIRLNPTLRFQARNDSDFQNLSEDPRFTELLYPEKDGMAG